MSFIIDAFTILKKKNSKIKFNFFLNKDDPSQLEKENITYLKNSNLNAKIFYLNSSSNFKKKIDMNYLNYFEKISDKNIWKIISSDRKYGRFYMNDIHAYREDKKKYENILINFVDISKRIEKILIKLKPNIIYISNGLSNLEVSILNILAKKYGAKVLVPHPSLYKNYIYFANDIYTYSDKIENFYKKVKKNFFSKKIKKLFEETQNVKGVESLDKEMIKEQISRMKKKNIINILLGDILYAILKHLFLKLIFLTGIKYKNLNILKQYNLIVKIKDEIFLKKMTKFLLSFKMPNLKKKYVYCPLFLIPETESLLKGNDFMNQAFFIETVSKNIPSNYKLYVKEHPGMLTSHSRKIEFYKRINLLPNVELVPLYSDGMELIKNSKLVIVVGGSSGFEAMLANKPVVTFSYFVYSFLGLTVANNNINDLRNDIHNAIKINLGTKPKQFEKKIKSLIFSISKTCYQISKPGFFFFKTKNFKDKEICGKELAEALISELNI